MVQSIMLSTLTTYLLDDASTWQNFLELFITVGMTLIHDFRGHILNNPRIVNSHTGNRTLKGYMVDCNRICFQKPIPSLRNVKHVYHQYWITDFFFFKSDYNKGFNLLDDLRNKTCKIYWFRINEVSLYSNRILKIHYIQNLINLFAGIKI